MATATRMSLQKSCKFTESILDKPRTFEHKQSLIGPILFAGSPLTKKSYYANEVAKQLNIEYLNDVSQLNSLNPNRNIILDICPSSLSRDTMDKIPKVIYLDDSEMIDNSIINSDEEMQETKEEQYVVDEFEENIVPIIKYFEEKDVLVSLNALSDSNLLTNAIVNAIYDNQFYVNQHRQSAFFKLDHILSDNIDDNIDYKVLASQFINSSLNENVLNSKRTAIKRRGVFLVTNNDIKLAEIERIMDRYGIEVIKTPHSVFNHNEFITHVCFYLDVNNFF